MKTYLITCECGETVPVQAIEVGTLISCLCGRSVEVPRRLEELKKLPLVKATAVSESGQSNLQLHVDAESRRNIQKCPHCSEPTAYGVCPSCRRKQQPANLVAGGGKAMLVGLLFVGVGLLVILACWLLYLGTVSPYSLVIQVVVGAFLLRLVCFIFRGASEKEGGRAIPEPGLGKAFGLMLVVCILRIVLTMFVLIPLLDDGGDWQPIGQTTVTVVLLFAYALGLAILVVTLKIGLPTTFGSAIGIAIVTTILLELVDFLTRGLLISLAG